jgi:hypothetical protein
MAITSAGSAGTAASFTSQSTWTGAVSIGNVAADEWVIAVLVADNINTTDGDNTEHGLSGEGLSWTKLGEYTNGNGAAAAGVTVSAWLARNTTGSTIGTFDFNAFFASAVVDKCISMWTFAAGASLALVPGSLQSNATDASNGYGSSTISGLPSVERLYFRALGKEASASGQITVSSGFTAIDVIRSRNHVDAVLARGEFIISTSTGATSNPVHAISGDTAGLFFALSEGEPAGSGNPWNYYAQA